uniref:RNase H domain-containing protein n=1 Tax=Macrostomum lignano TaxID=282301 RepID=A0A1I8GPR7_9PLAT
GAGIVVQKENAIVKDLLALFEQCRAKMLDDEAPVAVLVDSQAIRHMALQESPRRVAIISAHRHKRACVFMSKSGTAGTSAPVYFMSKSGTGAQRHKRARFDLHKSARSGASHIAAYASTAAFGRGGSRRLLCRYIDDSTSANPIRLPTELACVSRSNRSRRDELLSPAFRFKLAHSRSISFSFESPSWLCAMSLSTPSFSTARPGQFLPERKNQQAYQYNQPVYQQNQPVYQQNQPVYQQNQPVYQQNQPVYQQNQPVYQQNQPRRRWCQPSAAAAHPSNATGVRAVTWRILSGIRRLIISQNCEQADLIDCHSHLAAQASSERHSERLGQSLQSLAPGPERKNQQAYQYNQPVYQQNQPVYQQNQPVYQQNQPVYQQNQPVYQQNQPVYQQNQPVYYRTSRSISRTRHFCRGLDSSLFSWFNRGVAGASHPRLQLIQVFADKGPPALVPHCGIAAAPVKSRTQFAVMGAHVRVSAWLTFWRPIAHGSGLWVDGKPQRYNHSQRKQTCFHICLLAEKSKKKCLHYSVN